jgi:hypothetical protein
MPTTRLLRAFAYDPSLATELENYDVSEVLVRVRWEPDRKWADEQLAGDMHLEPVLAPGEEELPSGKFHSEPGLAPGPVGDYLEVVDVDPGSNRDYPPVDLDHPYLVAQHGLAPSEGNPQFHQQMVYAVAMTTIQHFERALGRQVVWSDRKVEQKNSPPKYVRTQRLRIYPHALRDENAYYDPQKKALLFGYFPARPQLAADGMPGGMVFSCLSHDIIAHETTHAILDGMQRYFLDDSNADVLAFHEAFADLVALFQHFTYPEILRRQIARARGNLDTETLLGQLAVQFGKATGRRSALRDAIGGRDKDTGKWTLSEPEPDAYMNEKEPHARGALLVAAIFDAFRAIYRHRTRDLLRIATGGTGILPPGDVHPDLVDRLAREAAKTAQHLLLMCIRAIDYCPPVDLTFGDYMRALITADYDLVPDDTRKYRVAIIEAFRARGIYPLDVTTLSEDSLRWRRPRGGTTEEEFARIFRPAFFSDHLARWWDEIVNGRLSSDQNSETMRKLTRMEISRRVSDFSRDFHTEIQASLSCLVAGGKIGGDNRPFGFNINFGHAEDQKFEVHQVRPVYRLGPDGRSRDDLLIQITQWRPGFIDPAQQDREDTRYRRVGQTKAPPQKSDYDFKYRGGTTFILDLESFEVRYAIQKDVVSPRRLERQREYAAGTRGLSLRELYFGRPDAGQRLSALHGNED